MKQVTTNIFWLIIAANLLHAQNNDLNRHIYQVGEKLVYRVSWSIFRLGTITMCTKQDSTSSDPSHIIVTMHVQSNPLIPFISIDEYNTSFINLRNGMSRAFYAKHRDGSEHLEIRMQYNANEKKVYFTLKNMDENRFLRNDTLSNVPAYVEGPSIFFIARALINTQKKLSVPTIASGRMATTDFNFNGETEWVETSAFDRPVRTRTFEGYAHWEGGTAAGVSGEFSGWLSDDSAAVIVISEMNVFLGSVRLELEHYEREGWLPPYQEITKKKPEVFSDMQEGI